MAFTVMKKMKCERLLKRQSRFEDVIVFDEEFESKYNQPNNYWLTFIDFCSSYKYDPDGSCLRTVPYKEIVEKANNWLRNLSQYKHEKLCPGTPIWSVINSETLYAKISLTFSESGEITHKRVMQIAKWPLIDELFMNLYCDKNTSSQNFEEVFNGRYIVVLLRVWIVKQPFNFSMSIEPPPVIRYEDYWPQTVLYEKTSTPWMTSASAKVDLKKKLRKTLSLDTGGNHHGEMRERLEKMEQITDRINRDIFDGKINGTLLNIVNFPCYYTNDDAKSADKKEIGKIPIGRIISMVRVFYLQFQIEKPRDHFVDDSGGSKKPLYLVGVADFVPKCISGGGFIKYPKFETQSDLMEKASQWLAQNSELVFLNCNSVDIKLKSMTSIDTSGMTFARNTGDFIRILRLCYLKLKEDDSEENPESQMAGSSSSSTRIGQPPPAPIYFQCKTITSINNSIKELKQQVNDYLVKDRWRDEINIRDRWKFLNVESTSIFVSNAGGDSKNRRNNSMLDCDQSFHAISISSSSMNRNMLNGINIFYDIGYFGQKSKTSTTISSNNNNNERQLLMTMRQQTKIEEENIQRSLEKRLTDNNNSNNNSNNNNEHENDINNTTITGHQNCDSKKMSESCHVS